MFRGTFHCPPRSHSHPPSPAGVGLFIARPRRIVVRRRLRALGSADSLLCGVSLRENTAPRYFHSLTLGPELARNRRSRRAQRYPSDRKKAGTQVPLLFCGRSDRILNQAERALRASAANCILSGQKRSPPEQFARRFSCLSHQQKFRMGHKVPSGILVGVTGFEPAASWSRTKRTTKLCHTPFQTQIV